MTTGEPDELEKIAQLAGELQIERILKSSGNILSGGERRRVEIARALATEPKFILLDEPFTGLDLALRDELINDIHIWQEKTPIISVTHDVTEAFQLGAEVIKIAEGRVVQQGPVAEVLARERERLLEQLNASRGSPA